MFIINVSLYIAMKQKIYESLQFMKAHPIKGGLAVLGIALPFVVYGLVFSPRVIGFAYSGDNCVSQLSLLPGILQVSSSDLYNVELKDEMRIGSYPVAARLVCVSAKSAPTDGQKEDISIAPFGSIIARKTYTVSPESMPKVMVSALSHPIPATKPLKLTLTVPDELFTYTLATEATTTDCTAEASVLRCDVGDLNLEQGSTYKISLERYFRERHIETIASEEVSILPAAKVKTSSVKANQVVYGKPSGFTIEIDKQVVRAVVDLVRIGDKGKEARIEGKVGIEGATITFNPSSELMRNANYKLLLSEVEADDGSGLADQVSIPFKMSGGPKVRSVSIGSYGVDPYASITVNFDQAMKGNQDITKYVSLAGAKATIVRLSDTVVRINLQGAGRCKEFTIAVKKGLASKYDVVSADEWKYSSRVRCYTVELIGKSSQGRSILAYSFGSGATTYMFTGAIHGNELSSKYTMDRFISDLDAHPSRVPSKAKVVIVPVVNPDGVVRAMRNNARDVNLNRNFPTPNWTSDIRVTGGVDKGGGGASAGSELETRALMQLTNRLNPRLVVTHHSAGYLVNTNDTGISISAGREYARLAGYRLVLSADTTETFGFEMTGTYEDWLYHRGTAAILVELNTNTGDHYVQNSVAMWAMLGR